MNTPPAGKPVIGLVGGVGSGKSTAAAELASLGCVVIDADAIGHDLLANADVRDAIRRRWGEAVFDSHGGVDRRALAKAVFNCRTELQALNEITWPRIGREIARRIALGLSDPSVAAVVLDAAVMCEAGWDRMCTHLVYVDAPARQRADRAAKRGLGRRAWEKREKMQISLDSKRAKCYCTVDNSSSAYHLREQIRRAFQRIVHQAT